MTAKQNPAKPRIVVVGSGFAGISAYTTLSNKARKKVEITLVSDSLFFSHIPLIHEVAAGTIQPELVYWPVTDYIKCPSTGYIHGRVVSVNAEAKTLAVKRADGGDEMLTYDFLVLAAGSEAYTFGTKGAVEYALPFRTLHDAERIRNRILDACKEAEATADGAIQKELLSFVLIGGGATGIELAGELSQMIKAELSCLYPKLTHLMCITIVERADGLLKERDPWFGRYIEKQFMNSGHITILCGRTVSEVTEQGVQTDKEFVSGRNVIWTGGARGTNLPIASSRDIDIDERSGRIITTPLLNIPAHQDVYVVGDQAFTPQPNGAPYGMRAQFAVRQGKRAALNILKALRGHVGERFEWEERGFILTIGKGHALAEIGGFRFTGLFAWIICHAVYIQSIVGFWMRMKSAWYWTKHFVKARNICQLTGVLNGSER